MAINSDQFLNEICHIYNYYGELKYAHSGSFGDFCMIIGIINNYTILT